MTPREREERLQSIGEHVRAAVAGGFDMLESIRESANDLAADELPDDASVELVDSLVAECVAAHLASQKTWPAVTDCDRLDAAFDELNRSGIVARQHFSCCGTCAAADIQVVIEERVADGRRIRGYTSYDCQSTESAADGYDIALNYGAHGVGEEALEAAALKIGHEVVDALARQGLKTEWDGTWDKRICVSLDWKRRRNLNGEPIPGPVGGRPV